MFRHLFPVIVIASWIPSSVHASDYYVGAAGGGDGSSPTSLQTLAWANANLQPGDVAYLCDTQGNFGVAIAPARSGTGEASRIVYRANPGDTPTITYVSNSVVIIERDYVTVDGITLHHPYRRWINGGTHCDHNTIQNCTMTQSYSDCSGSWDGINFGNHASHNKLLNNTIVGSKDGHKEGLYSATDTGGRFSHNLIEGNHFIGGFAHIAVGIYGHRGGDVTFNVLRDNLIENPLHTSANVFKDANHALIEGNVIRNSSSECFTDGDDDRCDENICGSDRDRGYPYGGGLQTGSEDLIIRRNLFVNNQHALTMNGWNPWESVRNRIYHNTFFASRLAVKSNTPDVVDDHVFKFNILDSSTEREIYRCLPNSGVNDRFVGNNIRGASPPIRTCADGNVSVAFMESTYPTLWANNTTSDPQFEDPGNGNFNLMPGSTLVDAAGWLTRVNDPGGGSGTSLPVDDARYFYSGDGEPWLIAGDAGDTILVDNPVAADFTVEIAAIDYSTNTLTLETVQSWDDNAQVFHCPAGVCFAGAAPDIGAYELEVEDIVPPESPRNLRISTP